MDLVPEVNNQLLNFTDVEGEVVVQAPHGQVSDLLAVSSLSVISPTTVVSSANLMMVVGVLFVHAVWVRREYRSGLRMHPWGAPVLRISVADVLLPTLTTRGRPFRKSRIQLQREVLCPRDP